MTINFYKSANKIIYLQLLLVIMPATLFAQGKLKQLYKDPNVPIQIRVKDLLSKMTIEEKAGQLNQLNSGDLTGPGLNATSQQEKLIMLKAGKIGSFLNTIGASTTRSVQKIAVEQSRLGIPLLFGYDVIHGYKTLFPIPLAEACSWDLDQVTENSKVAAKEAAVSGLHWTFAPMCDISTDPRWGRVMEGAGEDPYYASLLASARVKGFQGKLESEYNVLATVKHFAAYGAVEGGRDYNNVDVSRSKLWNTYLPPYEAAVKAGAATVMNSFNVLDGIPASGNKFLLTEVLKNKWGFKGFVVSDWNSFGEMIPHGFAADYKDVALKALKAGSMMDMESKSVINHLPQLIKEGKLNIAQVDDAVGRILYYKFKLGLFENPYRFSDEQREKDNLLTPAHRKVARIAGTKSIVLLKNSDQLLPLASKDKKIALVGFYANSKADMVDMWKGTSDYNTYVTVYDGLKAQYKDLTFADGYNSKNETSEKLIAEAVNNASAADVVIVNIGISGKVSGEDKSLADINIPAGQIALLKALHQTGKPIIALVTAGRPLVLTQVLPYTNAVLYCWLLGTETGNSVADVVKGLYNPTAKTVMSFPYAVGQVPVYYNHFNTGRPAPDPGGDSFYSRYLDIPNQPLFPFGYGLSYTTFNYRNLSLDLPLLNSGQVQNVSVTVKNTGKYDGEEIVQLYINDITASIVRPVKELKAYKKIGLKAGEEKTITFQLGAKDLSFFDDKGNVILEKGKFKIFVGGNSRDVLETTFELK
ncbi:beta-glucosidase BglX [Pedobacter frigiditerrae]|uniref:beta-glucosidase n=1 Tax=Pedobacter frigiditerrae TaxID=2530452 RepID=A0A4R0MQ99_9SPHI|nr:beta-glucosidase BglX [Pedobacter frigiditerrae]TCC88737.1 beta-glucosidase BglX [Pedobacter frigiditerrae]